ncbi:MAG: PIN domain-containing protein [Methylococcaceae bacterium]|nr:MAG: PIN domain-containing protein [Methylococcaceae bacterium]
MKIYIDACIAIYLIENHHEYGQLLERQFDAAINKGHEICISPLVKLECVVKPLKTNDLNLLDSFNVFFNQTTILSIPESIYMTAAELRASYNLKTPDALHIAIASFHGCDELWTNDNRLRGAFSKAINIFN